MPTPLFPFSCSSCIGNRPRRFPTFMLILRWTILWVSRGKTNREISIILSISPRTVQKHLEHIFQKLGVETRTAAAAKGLSIGDS